MNEAEQRAKLAEATDERASEIDLLELFYRLVERWKYIAAAAVAGALIMGIYSFVLATPVYEATSKLYVMSSSDSAINLSDLQIGTYLTSDYKEVFDTWEVQEMVLQNLDLDYTYRKLRSCIDVTNPGNTRILNITAHSGDPSLAAAIANEFASVASRYISETMKTDEPSLLSEALVPTKPVAPRKGLNIALGFVLGALAMAVVVVVQFLMDDKIKTAEDVRRYVDLPTLALVPANSGASRKNGKRKNRGARR